MTKCRSVNAFSAGGVVFRRAPFGQPSDANTPATATALAEIVLVGRASENFWVLPKGTPRPGESVEAVALREVQEETGVATRIVCKLGSIHYVFHRRGAQFNKEVAYFLMEACGGDVRLHDHEYDDAVWFPVASAADRLTYENEAAILRQAQPLIAERLLRVSPA